MTEIRHIGSYFKEIIDVAYHKLVILIFPYGGADMEKKGSPQTTLSCNLIGQKIGKCKLIRHELIPLTKNLMCSIEIKWFFFHSSKNLI